MFGVLVPRNLEQALEIDAANGDTKWADAVTVEMAMIDSYDTFTDKGKGYRPSKDYKKIRVHLVFACKHDGRRKARLVAGGHLTDTPIDSVYSSVVPLRGIRIMTFLAELNGNQAWATDIGNAYLESYTQEKVYIIGGQAFGDRQGHTLIITKALYGLRSSGGQKDLRTFCDPWGSFRRKQHQTYGCVTKVTIMSILPSTLTIYSS